jgi:hypothetical protein
MYLYMRITIGLTERVKGINTQASSPAPITSPTSIKSDDACKLYGVEIYNPYYEMVKIKKTKEVVADVLPILECNYTLRKISPKAYMSILYSHIWTYILQGVPTSNLHNGRSQQLS